MSGKFSVEATFKAKDEASKIVKGLEGNVGKFAHNAEHQLHGVHKMMEKIGEGIKHVGEIVGLSELAAGAGLAEVLKTGAEFDRALGIAAAKFGPEVDRGTEGFERLSEGAKALARTTELTATQAAEGYALMASAGMNAEQALATLPGTVDLMTVSQTDLATATDIAVQSLGAFNLKTKNPMLLEENLRRVTDAMVATKQSIPGMFEAIQEGAPIATAAGASVESFIAIVAKMQDAGVKGAAGGTAVKQMYLALAKQSKDTGEQLGALGIHTRDAHGNMRDLVDILGEVEKKTAKMGSAKKLNVLENIFGKRPAANVAALLQGGIEGIEKMRDTVQDADGITGETAEKMRDTVEDDLHKFSSAIDEVKISIFGMTEGPIRGVIKSMTAWMTANKGVINSKLQEFVSWVRDNLPEIVTRLEQIGKAVVVFYALEAAVSVAKLGIALYTGIATAASWATGKFGKSAADAAVEVEGLGGASKLAALKDSINGTTSLLGKAGLLGAAALVGYEIGSWADDKWHLSDTIAGWMAQLMGVNKELDKAGGATNQRGIQPGGEKVHADGTVTDATGKILQQGGFIVPKVAPPEQSSGAQYDNNGFRVPNESAPEATPAAQYDNNGFRVPMVSPQERAARTIEESTTAHTSKAEIVIRDETGRAEVAKKLRAPGLSLSVEPSGAF